MRTSEVRPLMNLRRLILCLSVGLAVGLAGPIPAQNNVLQLDGRVSYVQLPPAIFSGLTEATVEAWVKFDVFHSNVRVFDYGARSHEMYLGCVNDQPDLKFLIADPESNRHRIEVPAILQAGRWCHLAVTTGRDGVRL